MAGMGMKMYVMFSANAAYLESAYRHVPKQPLGIVIAYTTQQCDLITRKQQSRWKVNISKTKADNNYVKTSTMTDDA